MTTPATLRMSTPPTIAAARTLLFVPGDRPDRFDKAAGSGADLVVVDLEDAVAPEHKDRARRAAAEWPGLGHRCVVRVNAPGTPWFEADLRMAAGLGCPVMVPKAEDPAVLAEVAARCTPIPLIETALGAERAYEVCSVPGVVRAAFGNVDLAAQLGVAPDDTLALAYARSRLVLASAAAGIAAPVDGVTTAVRDTGALTADTAHAQPARLHGQALRPPRADRPGRRGLRPDGERTAVGAGGPGRR